MSKRQERDEVLNRWLERDLSAQARLGNLRRAYRRESELEQLVDWIEAGRGVLLTGEAGVGKTALIEELVARTYEGRGPARLEGRRILQLSLQRGVATLTRQHSPAEELGRLITVLAELGDRVVVYLRDIELAWDFDFEDSLDQLALSVASPLLGEGQTRAVRRVLASATMLERSVTTLMVTEPSIEQCRLMIGDWADARSASGRGTFEPQALDGAIEIASRFLPGIRLPRKVIEPLDQLVETIARRRAVVENDVVELFSRRYGLPLEMIDPQTPLDLESLRADIGAKVLGQEEAVGCMVDLLGRLKAGLLPPERPLGLYLFVGPSGVGKTLLAQTIADRLLGNEGGLLRLNMADFPGDGDALALFGDPGSYQPAQRQGELTRRLSGVPIGVLLLDELEKAAPAVRDRFFQLFDEGSLINGNGETISCRGLLIVATTNAGSGLWQELAPGFDAGGSENERVLEARLRESFRFELLDRFDRILAFRPLDRETIEDLVRRQIAALGRRSGLRRRDLSLETGDDAVEWIIARGYHPELGVRKLARLVEQEAGAAIARRLLDCQDVRAASLKLCVVEDHLTAEVVAQAMPEQQVGEAEPRSESDRPSKERAQSESGDSTEESERAWPFAAMF